MGTLFVVATPLGNLKDITLRALEILKEVDLIVCEDTRRTLKLLNHYGIKKPLLSYHEHSRLTKVDQIIGYLQKGKKIALVTDHGTPGLADPGGRLIEEALEKLKDKIKIVPIPGPSALTAAASISGFYLNKFIFYGFIPHKKGKKKLFQEIAQEKKTVIFYESPHRILKTLSQLKDYLDKNRKIVVGRELTKVFETIYRGNIEEVLEGLRKDEVKGEFVVVVEGRG